MKALDRLAADNSGATAVEYALIASAIAAIIVVIVLALGGKVSNLFSKTNEAWK